MFTLCPYYVYYVCDDFPSVVLYLDHNNSKETSSLSTPNDNAPVFLCLWIKIHFLKKLRICKEIFFGEGRQLSYLAFAVSYFGFSYNQIHHLFSFYKRNYRVGVEMTKLCCWYCYQNCYQYISFYNLLTSV